MFLKNAQNLTINKKLVWNTFYDSKITETNLWAASEIRFNNNFIQPFQTLVYNNFRNRGPYSHDLATDTQVTNLKNPARNMSFYELSYFWFITRIAFLNGLSNN